MSEPFGALSAPSDRRAATIAVALGVLALGVVTLAYGDLLLQWQPAPRTAAWRTPVAWASGALGVAIGLGLFVARFRPIAALAGAAWFGLWVVALHVPAVIAARGSVVSLLGVAEITAMACALGILALPPEARRYKRVLVAAFGACAIVFGVSHFVYMEFTAAMVPDWMPGRPTVAWLTGAVHAATGVCLLLGAVLPVAAWIEAAMMASFVLLLHVPRVLAAPTRAEFTMLAIATMLTASAWLVAASTRGGLRTLSPLRPR